MSEEKNVPNLGDTRIYSGTQLNAIQASYRIGEQLAEDHPEIVGMRRGGLFANDIAERVIPDEVTISRDVARHAVGVALRKLIPSGELSELVRAQRAGIARDEALRQIEEGTGLFGLDAEALAVARKEGGKAAFDKKVGVHGLSREERQEVARIAIVAKGGIHSVCNIEMTLRTNFSAELADLARDPTLKYEDIARRLFDNDDVDASPQTYAAGVGKAIRSLLSELEIRDLRSARKKKLAAKQIENDPEAHKARSVLGGVAAKEKGTLEGEVREKALKARGIEPWKPGEYQTLFKLIADQQYKHGPGTYSGRPNYQKIADCLNELYHGASKVREGRKLSHVVASSNYDSKNRPSDHQKTD